MNQKWDIRWLQMAKFVSNWSKDPSTKVGTVLARDKDLVSIGYNGFPEGLEDDVTLYENREEKLKRIVHGELNAIIKAHADVTGCTLYTYPFLPCHVCAGLVIQARIKRVVTLYSDNERWADSFELSLDKFRQAKLDITFYDESVL